MTSTVFYEFDIPDQLVFLYKEILVLIFFHPASVVNRSDFTERFTIIVKSVSLIFGV